MPVSEAHLDRVQLVRLEWPSYSGHLGLIEPHGVTFVDGVAQNGVTEAAAVRLCGAIGPALRVVGPWEPPVPPAAVAVAVPVAPVPVVPSTPAVEPPVEPFARVSRASRGR